MAKGDKLHITKLVSESNIETEESYPTLCGWEYLGDAILSLQPSEEDIEKICRICKNAITSQMKHDIRLQTRNGKRFQTYCGLITDENVLFHTKYSMLTEQNAKCTSCRKAKDANIDKPQHKILGVLHIQNPISEKSYCDRDVTYEDILPENPYAEDMARACIRCLKTKATTKKRN